MSDAPSRAAKVETTWGGLPGGVVDGGEIVILAIKPSMWRPLLESGPWLIAACMLAAAVSWMHQSIPGLSVQLTAQLILLVGMARLGVAMVRWVPTWYVLTNRRIMNIQGVRVPRISSSLLIEIRNTYLHVGQVEKLAGLGSITFVTDHAQDPPRIWEAIAKPDLVHDKVRRAIESAIDQPHMA